jgi:hypothetical protein
MQNVELRLERMFNYMDRTRAAQEMQAATVLVQAAGRPARSRPLVLGQGCPARERAV